MDLIYTHNTPEVLVSSFTNVAQVKNSSYCGLIDENFPEDVMALEGDALEIKEPPGTLNIDVAMAIAFNSIRDCDGAKQVAKLLIANGSNMDVHSIMYYKSRLLNGPFSSCVSSFMTNSMAAAAESVTSARDCGIQRDLGGSVIRNQLTKESFQPSVGDDNCVDQKFNDYLAKKMKQCGAGQGNNPQSSPGSGSPCDYLNHRGSFGFLARAGKPNLTNAFGIPGLPPPVEDPETFNFIPPVFQRMSLGLSQIAANTFVKLRDRFASDATKKAEAKALKDEKPPPPPSGPPPSNSTGTDGLLSPDLANLFTSAAATTLINAAVKKALGDCSRLEDFRQKYNPFSYLLNGGQNGEAAADPGLSGVPDGGVPVRNASLNAQGPTPNAPLPNIPNPTAPESINLTGQAIFNAAGRQPVNLNAGVGPGSGNLYIPPQPGTPSQPAPRTGFTDRSSGILRLGNTQAPVRTGLTDRSSGTLNLGGR